jgi:hypothetical protein
MWHNVIRLKMASKAGASTYRHLANADLGTDLVTEVFENVTGFQANHVRACMQMQNNSMKLLPHLNDGTLPDSVY